MGGPAATGPRLRRSRLVQQPDDAGLFDALSTATGIVLAVSGGPDSVALMYLAARWRDCGGRPPIAVGSVDHGLRPDSRPDAEAVVAAAQALGFSACTLPWLGEKPRSGLQAKARAARYGLLAAYARTIGASHLVTAHTLDDQAETLLIRLARGSGPTGLAGMRIVSRRCDGLQLVRPLLAVRKSDLLALCHANGWPYVEDPANRNPAYDRTRWRALAPALQTLGVTPERLGRLAARLARAEDALAIATEAAATRATLAPIGPSLRFSMAALAAEPEELVQRVLANALTALAGPEGLRLDRLEDLTRHLLLRHGTGGTVRRTLHRCIVTLDSAGILTVALEGMRQRGTRMRVSAP